MTVEKLIDLLRTFPKDLPVVYRCYSEYNSLAMDDLVIGDLCKARPDGWVHDARPDKPTVQYLIFPGN